MGNEKTDQRGTLSSSYISFIPFLPGPRTIQPFRRGGVEHKVLLVDVYCLL